MHSSTLSVPHPLPPISNGAQPTPKTDGIVYQIVTVAVILLVLGSMF